MGRRERDRKHSLPKNNLIQDSKVNEENGTQFRSSTTKKDK
jgi:hypothetical protein